MAPIKNCFPVLTKFSLTLTSCSCLWHHHMSSSSYWRLRNRLTCIFLHRFHLQSKVLDYIEMIFLYSYTVLHLSTYSDDLIGKYKYSGFLFIYWIRKKWKCFISVTDCSVCIKTLYFTGICLCRNHRVERNLKSPLFNNQQYLVS